MLLTSTFPFLATLSKAAVILTTLSKIAVILSAAKNPCIFAWTGKNKRGILESQNGDPQKKV